MNAIVNNPASAPRSPIDPDDQNAPAIEIDLVAIWSTFYRNRILFLTTLAVFLVLGAIYLILATPIYQASASIQIEEQSARVLASQQELDPARSPSDSDRFLKTQTEIIESRSLSQAVADDLRLVGNQQFMLSMGANPDIKPVGVLNQRASEREAVLKILNKNLSVTLPSDSRVIQVKFKSPDPTLAARVVNSYADNYIRLNLQRKYDTSAYAREFLSKQLDEAKRQLERSERDAIAYARRARLIDASNSAESDGKSSGPRSLTTARLVRLNQAFAEAVARRIAAQERWQLASGSNLMSLPEVLSNLAIQQLLQKRAEAQAEYEDQRQTRREDYPTLKQAKAQVDELNRQINAIATSIRTSIRSDYQVTLREEQELRARIGALETDTLSEQNRNVQMSILERATDTNRTLYDSLLQRYRELSAEAGIQPNNIQIVDRADVPAEPVSPKVWLTFLIATLAGCVAAVLLILGRHHMDDTIRSADELQYKLGLPMLGAVPTVAGDGDVLAALADPKSAVSEAFNSIRASLLLSSTEGLPQTILFTSTQPSEGKTTTVFAVSTGLAKIGKTVVIIDLDMRRPAQAKNFGLKNDIGISDVLAHSKTIDEVTKKTNVPGVSLISCGPIPPNPTELLSSPMLKSVLTELTTKFDVVIVDAPPILGLADAVLLGAVVQGTVLVVEAGRTYRGGSKAAVARMQKAGSHMIGAILTKQDTRNLGYGYDYAYQYRYGDDVKADR